MRGQMASSCVPRYLRQLASKRRILWLFVTPVQAFDHCTPCIHSQGRAAAMAEPVAGIDHFSDSSDEGK